MLDVTRDLIRQQREHQRPSKAKVNHPYPETTLHLQKWPLRSTNRTPPGRRVSFLALPASQLNTTFSETRAYRGADEVVGAARDLVRE